MKEVGDSSAPIMLLLHGGGVSGWMWQEQIQHFSRHYNVLILDLPGHGRSVDIPFESIHQTALDIKAILLSRRNGRPVTVIGFSLGAQIALELISLPELHIEHAIIISGLVMPMKYALPFLLPLTKLAMPLMKNKFFAKAQAKVLYIDERLFPLYYDDSLRIKANDLIQVLRENMSYQLPARFSACRTKLLVLVGSKEKTPMLKSAAAIALGSTHSSGYIATGIGHGLPLADANFFNRIVDHWSSEQPLPDGLEPLR